LPNLAESPAIGIHPQQNRELPGSTLLTYVPVS
jgi:hypothetical protein